MGALKAYERAPNRRKILGIDLMSGRDLLFCEVLDCLDGEEQVIIDPKRWAGVTDDMKEELSECRELRKALNFLRIKAGEV